MPSGAAKQHFTRGHSGKDSSYLRIVLISLDFTLSDGTDLLPLMHYIRPDDGNPHDSTVVQIILPEAAKPGDTVSIKVIFVTKLPGRIRRTGYKDDYYLCCTMVSEIRSL